LIRRYIAAPNLQQMVADHQLLDFCGTTSKKNSAKPSSYWPLSFPSDNLSMRRGPIMVDGRGVMEERWRGGSCFVFVFGSWRDGRFRVTLTTKES